MLRLLVLVQFLLTFTLGKLVLSTVSSPDAVLASKNGLLSASKLKTIAKFIDSNPTNTPSCNSTIKGWMLMTGGILSYCDGISLLPLTSAAPYSQLKMNNGWPSLIKPPAQYPKTCKDLPANERSGVKWVLLQPGDLPRPVSVLCDFDTEFLVYFGTNGALLNGGSSVTISGVAVAWAGCNADSSLHSQFQAHYGSIWVGHDIFQALAFSSQRFALYEGQSEAHVILDYLTSVDVSRMMLSQFGSRFNALLNYDHAQMTTFNGGILGECTITSSIDKAQSFLPYSAFFFSSFSRYVSRSLQLFGMVISTSKPSSHVVADRISIPSGASRFTE